MTPALGDATEQIDMQIKLPIDGWRLVTDGVMGGVSEGAMALSQRHGRNCLQLQGTVSTRNNGGFIQLAHDLENTALPGIEQAEGVSLWVSGNGESYNLHLRTAGLRFPWQAYRASFEAGQEWSRIDLPFAGFTPYKTSQAFDPRRLKRIGIVAIGRDFNADLCVADIGFY